MVLLQFEKEKSTDGDLTGGSSSPEISSENSSLTNGHSSLSDVINEWKNELEGRKCELKSKNAKISDLEERLRIKEEEICKIKNDLKSIQLERDKSCQMVSLVFYEIAIFRVVITYFLDMIMSCLSLHEETTIAEPKYKKIVSSSRYLFRLSLRRQIIFVTIIIYSQYVMKIFYVLNYNFAVTIP